MVIIPYQELPGNYNARSIVSCWIPIIPYQELPGNYNLSSPTAPVSAHYTIPRTTRELQQLGCVCWKILKLYHTKNYQGTTTRSQRTEASRTLYHTKNYQGTTTFVVGIVGNGGLYHTKNYQGTTTTSPMYDAGCELYHTKNYQGTTTLSTFG